ncbi:MAG: hypothetical protein UW87_C0031G0003 [Candidatus Moranbacteria bacterium GW2011_GWC2_45_10]|nr:MAG: hypothetical protein UW87_C0031G0003 [Candidatus Moranbacteria bacterium GW2011_GWC2_45_10]
MDPEAVGVVAERDRGAHGQDVRIDGHRKHNGREDREDLHRHVQFVGKQGIVGLFQRLDRFFVGFQRVPEADVRADQVRKIRLDVGRDERGVFLDQGFKDGSLRFQRPSEIENVALDDGYFEHHLFFLAIENLVFDLEQVFMDMVELGKTAFQQKGNHVIKKMRRAFFHIKPSFPFAFGKLVEKFRQLVYILAVSGDQVVVSQDDVQLPGIGRAGLGVEKGNMDSQKEAVFVLGRARADRRCDEFFDCQGMDVEIFLQI